MFVFNNRQWFFFYCISPLGSLVWTHTEYKSMWNLLFSLCFMFGELETWSAALYRLPRESPSWITFRTSNFLNFCLLWNMSPSPWASPAHSKSHSLSAPTRPVTSHDFVCGGHNSRWWNEYSYGLVFISETPAFYHLFFSHRHLVMCIVSGLEKFPGKCTNLKLVSKVSWQCLCSWKTK